MKKLMLTAAAVVMGSALFAAPADSLKKMGDASKGYEVLYVINPKAALKNQVPVYTLDNSKKLAGVKAKRVAYAMYLRDAKNAEKYIFISMDNFAQDITKIGIPVKGVMFQKRVKNLDVKSNVKEIKTGKIAEGNIEFWCGDYGTANAAKVPNASDKFYDWGDGGSSNGFGYGSMQIHNFTDKQTLFAFNNHRALNNSDVGIGNNTAKGGQPDWTFSGSTKNYTEAEIVILIQK